MASMLKPQISQRYQSAKSNELLKEHLLGTRHCAQLFITLGNDTITKLSLFLTLMRSLED